MWRRYIYTLNSGIIERSKAGRKIKEGINRSGEREKLEDIERKPVAGEIRGKINRQERSGGISKVSQNYSKVGKLHDKVVKLDIKWNNM